jgi:dTDP-4-amino-4,6-dideoxygalactose transaminase
VADRPAILNGTPLRAGKQWPRWPQWDENERRLLGQVLESGRWSRSRGGELAASWAADFAALQGAAHGLALTNGTHTLEAALAACDVGEGDEVIVPALTFVSTATAALAVNATPVLVDVVPETLCIDPAAVAAAIGGRTRALIVVHMAGTACDMDALLDLCRRHDLALIEDCAHAPGTRWRGRGVGSLGSFGSFSFESHKLMTAGEGGALITNDDSLRARALSYVDCGRVEGGHHYGHARYGSNLRMSEWQGAVLAAQLERFGPQHRRREERAALLDAELAALPGIEPQPGDPRMDSRARYSYLLHYDPGAFGGLPPRAFEAALAAEGIDIGASYPSLNTLELFRSGDFGPRLRGSAPRLDYAALSLPRAEHAAEHTLWLDHRMLLAEPEDVLDLVRAIARVQASGEKIARSLGGPRALALRLGAALRRRSS